MTQSTISKIEQLRAYALTAKAAIYNEDAMTAIELSGQTACKVNECVECINQMLDVIADIARAIDYDPANEEITIS